ncbi:MAG: 2OG-Fe(II) oxygenase [Planctomycetia bacterium]|nr:2OG-Fe(II) oxygenase [Planctomycetia bacterium]
MNPKKAKEKDRRRARKLADEAWEAVNEQNLDLAEKIIRRAVATQPDNPVLWNDQGMVLALRSKDRDAEEAFRTAISLAPTYAEPMAQLAAMRARGGYLRDAVRLMETATQFARQSAAYAERLAAYQALIESQLVQDEPMTTQVLPPPAFAETPPVSAHEEQMRNTAKVLDWADIGQRLTRDGCVLIPTLLDPTTCVALQRMFEDDRLFAKTVVMDRADFGRGVYRYFQAPIPPLVDGVRRAVYPHVARIINEWQGLLNETDRFPEEWEGFRLQCQAAGQTTPTPILLQYGPGGFNALHRDLRGTVYFPIQMAVVLSPVREASNSASEGFRGGEFVFCDAPASKKARRLEIPAGLGDALLFCTRDRLVRVGGAYGLQPVKHGVNHITEGSRMVLGVPFHEYR